MKIAPARSEYFGGKEKFDSPEFMAENQPSTDNSSEEEKFKTPKAILYFVLSILWIFPSLTAIWMIAGDFSAMRNAQNVREFFFAVKLEQWVGVILLLLHAVFIFLAIRGRRRL